MKINKRGITIFFLIILFFLFNFIDIDNDNSFPSLITFFSIVFGFCITSLSVIANSSFSKKLYKIENPDNNSQTLLHELIFKFRDTIYFILTNIIIVFFYLFLGKKLFPSFNFLFIKIGIRNILISLIWSLACISIIKLIFLIPIFIKYILKSGGDRD
jgi:hypothetical protein